MKIIVSFVTGSYDSYMEHNLPVEYESCEQFIVDLENLYNEAKIEYKNLYNEAQKILKMLRFNIEIGTDNYKLYNVAEKTCANYCPMIAGYRLDHILNFRYSHGEDCYSIDELTIQTLDEWFEAGLPK